MKNLFSILVLAAAILTFTVPTHAADTKNDRIAATREYLKVVPVEKMAKDLTSEMLKTVPQEQQEMAAEVFKKALDSTFLESIMLTAMPKHFTTDEIKALTRFYASPEGASVMSKLGAYTADMMPAIQSRIMSILAPYNDQKNN
jgi:hypothetical protein